ncbi:MAG: SDR family oxidoreductase [Myxococcota bacterium]
MPQPLRCDPSLLALDLRGKTHVVTGANAGIGRVTAQQLARQGARVVLACRNLEAGQAAAEEIQKLASGAEVETMRLDLGDLASVRSFAEAFSARFERLDGLVNNAGVMNTPQAKTKDGFEMQFGINHLGHFLLTECLVDMLKATEGARVVCLSSCYHDKAMGREGELVFDDLHFDRRPYDGWRAYAQSKLANLLHAKGLAKRYGEAGLTAVSVHPGWVRTQLARHSMPVWVQDYLLRPVFGLMGMIEPWDGAQTTLYALLSPEMPQHNGGYFSQLGIYRDKAANKGGWPLRSPSPHAHDDAAVDRLWSVSADLVGLGENASQTRAAS